MAGADVRRFSRDRRGLALNFFLGIAGAALLALADTLVQATLILPVFVARLTDSNTLVGMVPALGIGVWGLVRLPAATITQGRRRQLPWATTAALVRMAAMGLLAYVALDVGTGDDPRLLRAFFICYGAYAVAGGFAAVPAVAVIAKTISDDGRVQFFRQRTVWSAVLAIVAGVVAARLLGDAGPGLPRGFALLFLASTVCLAAASFLIASMREPWRGSPARQPTVGETLRVLPAAAADPNYRRFVGFRLLLALAAAADPFYVVYAVREVGVSAGVIGVYVVVLVAARTVGRAARGPLADRQGDRGVLQVAALLRLVVPLIALLVPYALDAEVAASRFDDQRLAAILFGVVVAALGLAIGVQERANFAYLLDIAPGARRLGYAGLTNALLGVAAFASLLAGAGVDRQGFRALFLAAAAVGLVAVFASGALTDTNVRARPTAAAWRLRRAGGQAPDPRR